MDANRGRVVHQERRASKLAVVVAVQNVLVAACLVVTLYVYSDVHGRNQTSGANVHIRFEPISSISHNATLQFNYIQSSYMMSLVGKNNDTIYVNCTGPYVLYMNVCYVSLSEKEVGGMLQLQVEGDNTPVSSFALNASQKVCRGLHSIAYLRAKDKASLHLYSTDGFKVKQMTVGLSYLLGRECDY